MERLIFKKKKFLLLIFLFIVTFNIKAQEAGIFTDSPLFYLSGDTIKAKPGLTLPGVTSSIGAITGEDVTTALGYTPVTNARTINGRALTANISITKADLGIDTTAYLNATNINTGTLSNSRLASSVYTSSTLDTSRIPFKNQTNNFTADINISGLTKSTNFSNNTPTTITSSTIDASENNLFIYTLEESMVFDFINLPENKWISVWITNNEPDYTVGWHNVAWPNGSAPTQSINGHTDIYSFIQINSVVYGSVVQNY